SDSGFVVSFSQLSFAQLKRTLPGSRHKGKSAIEYADRIVEARLHVVYRTQNDIAHRVRTVRLNRPLETRGSVIQTLAIQEHQAAQSERFSKVRINLQRLAYVRVRFLQFSLVHGRLRFFEQFAPFFRHLPLRY